MTGEMWEPHHRTHVAGSALHQVRSARFRSLNIVDCHSLSPIGGLGFMRRALFESANKGAGAVQLCGILIARLHRAIFLATAVTVTRYAGRSGNLLSEPRNANTSADAKINCRPVVTQSGAKCRRSLRIASYRLHSRTIQECRSMLCL